MNILIIGQGGREHAFAWKASQSPKAKKIFVAPGNAGTELEENVVNVDIDPLDINRLINFAHQESIDITIVGPEAPLVAGIADEFQAAGLACIGPNKAAAQLEGSKSFSKAFMRENKIPTANYACFTNINQAKTYIQNQIMPVVIKADGLAAGKGVVIAHTQTQAIQTVQAMLSGSAFGNAGKQIIVEEYLQGEEASFIVVTDGTHCLALPPSQDHKARDNGDKGPNTGGMGAYSPAPIITQSMNQQIMQEVIAPTIQGMQNKGIPYQGFLYAGLMITTEKKIKVLEFNCRFGDPEAQVILLRLKSDFIALCQALLNGQLKQVILNWDPRPALGVVLASQGYPENYRKGECIQGLPQAPILNCKIFHAGTKLTDQGIVTDGGRLLCVTAFGDTFSQAKKHAYQWVKQIHSPNMHYRTDIGYRATMKSDISYE